MANDDLRKKILPIYRIAVLGAKGVGKTSFINTFVNNSFDPLYEETENDIRKYRRVYDINKNPTEPQYVLFQIEDIFPINHEDLENDSDFVKSQIFYGLLENKQVRTESTGLQNIMSMDKQIYGFIFLYDVNDLKSFQSIYQVIDYISNYCEKKTKYSGFVSKKILVGNKMDQIQDILPQDIEDKIKDLLSKYPMKKFLVSAKTSYNITSAFEEIGKQISADIKMEMIEKEWFEERATQIKDIETQKKEKGKGGKQDQKKLKSKQKEKQVEASDDEDNAFDQEDDEFANIPLYSQSMDDSNEGCRIF